jgi:aspartyl-tRNA(Asn)/glutamyl-tRNA(Gln) amidotransferase subunit C
MLSTAEIEKLAKLARITITDDEKAQFGKEIESILGYVSEIQQIAKESKTTLTIKNIVREDVAVNTDPKNLLGSAPHTEGDFIAVKKILS